MDKQLLLITHAPSANTQALVQALVQGVQAAEEPAIRWRQLTPFATEAEDIRQADGLILFTPENFGYMSGALKDCFDRVYYPCLEKTNGKPYACVVRAGHDGTGAVRAISSLCQGLQWRPIQAPLICKGAYAAVFERRCHDLGQSFAAGLAMGIF